nr:MAG: ICEA Protein [Bacteriophage sp.]
MSFSKKKREAVYAKYDGHCAYCGRAIDIKDMQVDHFKPQRAWNAERTKEYLRNKKMMRSKYGIDIQEV